MFLACSGTALCDSPKKMLSPHLCFEAFPKHVSEQFQYGENNDMKLRIDSCGYQFESLEIMMLGIAV